MHGFDSQNIRQGNISRASYPGLDTNFFPNLGVGQPSNNTDLSEIEIYLGMIIIYIYIYIYCNEKIKNRGELWS